MENIMYRAYRFPGVSVLSIISLPVLLMLGCLLATGLKVEKNAVENQAGQASTIRVSKTEVTAIPSAAGNPKTTPTDLSGAPGIDPAGIPQAVRDALPTPTGISSKTERCGWPPERVLIISVDALRPDAIAGSLPPPFLKNAGAAPFLLHLARAGSYTWSAQTVRPSITLPAHASMLSGFDVATHKADTNSLWKTTEAKIQVPTVFQRAHEKGLVTALIATKPHLNYIEQDEYLDYHLNENEAEAARVADRAAAYIRSHDFGLMFIYFGDADNAGHASGWMSAKYLSAVKEIDRAIEAVFQALREAGRTPTTLVIVNADHGGSGKDHSDASKLLNRTIPWIVFGPCVKQGHTIARTVNVFDTAATALWALGIELPAEMDGAPVREAFETTGMDGAAPEPAEER
jgi:hypothetical protein